MNNDRRDSVIYFEQEHVSPVTLRIEAKIRPQLTIFPQHVSVTTYLPNDKHTNVITVHDWTDSGLKTIELRSEEPWISTIPPRQNKAAETLSPHIAWESECRINTETMGPGKHRGRLELIACDEKIEYRAYIPVSLEVSSVIKVIPSSLFFGEMEIGTKSTIACTVLTVPSDKTGIDFDIWDSLEIDHDFSDELLRAKIEKVSDSKGLLTIDLTPKNAEPLKGNVTLKIGDDRFHDLVLPVIVHVKNDH